MLLLLLSCTHEGTKGLAPDLDTGTYVTEPWGDPDWDAVDDWLDTYTAEIRAAGVCPTEPPQEVMQLSGRLRPVKLETFEALAVRGMLRKGGSVDEFHLYTSPNEYVGGEAWETCDEVIGGAEVWLDRGQKSFGGSDRDGEYSGPPYLIDLGGSVNRGDLPGASGQHYYMANTGYVDESSETRGAAYILICLDEAPGAIGGILHSDLEWGPALWRGVALVHTEYPTGFKSDWFWPIGEITCGYAENAGTFHATEDIGVYFEDCDGIDNDLDGTVDEGAEDDNHNGVPDCQEGLPP